MKTDSHITLQADDELDRYPFARVLVKGLLASYKSGQNSLVIGLNGEWGLGKSSLLEFIKSEVIQQTKEEKTRNYMIEFNPWSNFTEANIHQNFFREIGIKLGNYNKQFEELKKYAESIKNSVAEANKANIEPKSKAAIWFLTKFTKFNKYSLEQQKKDVDERLADDNIKLFIFLDDIDRLQPKEIIEVFQLIKLNSNFKNTFFFIAFDKKVITEALKEEYGNLGESYIEKIVQLDYTLPIIANEDLSRLFAIEINKVLNSISLKFKEPNYRNLAESNIGNLWESHLRDYFSNIRHIKRFCNALETRLPVIINDVNLLDFILIEILRLFDYETYEWIIKNHNELITFKESGIDSLLNQKSKKPGEESSASDKLKNLLSKSVINESSIKIIEKLFFHSAFLSESDLIELLAKQKRVASKDYFEHYFSFKVLESNVPNSDIDNYFLDPEKRKEILNKFKEKGLFRKFLRELLFIIQELTVENLKVHYKELFDYSDENDLVSYQSKYFGQTGWFITISFLMDLSKHFKADNSYSYLMQEALSDEKSYSRYLFLSSLINMIENIGSYDHVKDFPSNVLDDFKTKILLAQKKGVIYFSDQIKAGKSKLEEAHQITVLKTLSKIDPENYKLAIRDYIKKAENALLVFKYSLSATSGTGITGAAYSIHENVHMMPMMNIESLNKRLSQIPKNGYEGKNLEYLELFYNLKRYSFKKNILFTLNGEKLESDF
jgi:hypothetical protein